MQLDEQALRRDGFRPGQEIELWDGQRWHFSMPRVGWRRSRSEGSKGVEAFLTLGRFFDEAIAAIDTAQRPSELASGLLNLGASMLLANYNLTDEALNAILVVDTEDEANKAVWLQILRAARGVPPEENLPDPVSPIMALTSA